jgi:hypothetical protein
MGEYRDVLGALYHAIGEVAGAQTVIDSTKYPTYGWVIAGADGIRLTPLQLVRDSRAVAFSSTRVVASSLPLPLNQRRASASARHWIRQNLAAEVMRFRSRHYGRLRYEDLAARPGQVLQALGAKLGITPPTLSQTNSVTLPGNHMINGNPVRFQDGEIRVREDDEWRTAMPRRDALAVTAITAPLLLRYGYSLRYRQSA